MHTLEDLVPFVTGMREAENFCISTRANRYTYKSSLRKAVSRASWYNLNGAKLKIIECKWFAVASYFCCRKISYDKGFI